MGVGSPNSDASQLWEPVYSHLRLSFLIFLWARVFRGQLWGFYGIVLCVH